MSIQISPSALKNLIIRSKDPKNYIDILLRTLPYKIGLEFKTTNNKKVIEGLKKRYHMVQKLSQEIA